MGSLQHRQLNHILEYGDKEEIKQAIEMLTERLYKVGKEEGHSIGLDKGYNFGKEEAKGGK